MIRIEEGLPEGVARRDGPPAWITIGNFDGVHLGHRAILNRLTMEARRAGGETAVVTFDPHPRCVLQPDQCPPALTTSDEKAALLEEAGVDRLVVLHFDLEMSRWAAQDFCMRLLATFRLRHLIVGHDFALGHRRQGDIPFLRDWGAREGVTVEALDPVADAGGAVSSTRVREALGAGDMVAAAEILGRPWFADAAVEQVDGEWRALIPGGKALPAPGDYAVRTTEASEGLVSVPARPDHHAPTALVAAGLPAGPARIEFLMRIPEGAASATDPG